MPFKSTTVMSQRLEFVLLAQQEKSNISDICRKFEITRKTGYKWLSRYHESSMDGLVDLNRRPNHSPLQTSPLIERYICKIRKKNPEWG